MFQFYNYNCDTLAIIFAYPKLFNQFIIASSLLPFLIIFIISLLFIYLICKGPRTILNINVTIWCIVTDFSLWL